MGHHHDNFVTVLKDFLHYVELKFGELYQVIACRLADDKAEELALFLTTRE